MTRFGKYLLDNADIIAAGTATLCGNSYAASQIMLNSKRFN